MKKSVKIVFMSAVLMLMLSLCCFGASALEATGQCGDNVYWSFDESTGELVISGEGEMKNYFWYADAQPPFGKYDASIKTIVIDEGVTSVGSFAFTDCRNLTDITIPDGVTSIGQNAFDGCENLLKITLPDSVTEIGYQAFVGCSSLTSMVIPDGVESIYWAFDGCEKLENVILPDSITNMDSAFIDCSSLKNVVIPKNITSIGDYTFDGCTSLKSITIPEKVTNIGFKAFYGCTSLESINISGTVELGTMVFSNTAYFNNIENWDDDVLYLGNHLLEAKDTISGEYVIKPGTTVVAENAFSDCVELTNVIMPDSVVCVGERAFRDCSNLESVTIPEGITSIKVGTFSNCTNLSNIVLPEGLTMIGEDAFEYCTNLTYINIPQTTISIDNWAFVGCDSLESIKIPERVENIGYGAFAYCDNLIDIEIDASKIFIGPVAFGYTGYWFNFDNYDDEGMLYIGNHLINATSKSSPWNCKIKDGTLTIASGAFEEDDSLISVEIPNTVLIIGESVFSGCTNLVNVALPDSFEKINNYLFENCSSLNDVFIPTSVAGIGFYAFEGCENLTDVYYMGTKAEWSKIAMHESPGEALLNATIHFLGETECTHANKTVHAQQNATCTVNGYTAGVYCPDCEKWLSGHEIIEAKHSPVTYTQNATCGVNGYKLTSCSVCGESLDYEIIPAGEHEFSSWAVTKKSTCTVDGEESRSCSICGETETRTVTAQGHSWSAWKITEATLMSAGEKTRSCSACGKTERVVLPKLEGDVAEDRNSGVKVEYTDDSYNGNDMQVLVQEDFTGSQYLGMSYGNFISWNIKTYVDGKEVQPDAPVLVTIPIPSNFNKDMIVVYHVDSATGSLEKIETVVIEGDYIKFLATSFSIYMVIDESSVIEEDPSDNCDCNCHKSGFMGFIWKIINFFNKLFKTKATCTCGVSHY